MLNIFLEGVRVLDLSQYLPGPFASRLLADMGADVVKVEPPGGEPGRRLDANGRETVSPYYHVVNAGKRIVDLDLRSEAGQSTLCRLVESADVLLESFRPGVLERLGFGEHRLKALNPSLVHCALSGFGQTGPLRLVSGHDLNYVAVTGALDATGTAETPVIPFPPMSDHAGALMAVISVLGALMARARGGGGAYLDVSLSESLMFLQELAFAFDAKRGRGLLTGGSACYQIYRTADGRFVTLSPLEPKFWANFCNAVGRPDWIPRQFEPVPQRALIADVAALIGSQPLAHWESVLTDADCCYQAVIDHAEVRVHPHVRARGLVGNLGRDTEVRTPIIVDGRPPPSRREAVFTDAEAVIGTWKPA
ncbi:MAG: CoA transferase [Rhodospirillales bacterium]|nr:MAG: CoA transferase [Rhodospirillales bacterium]